MTKRMCPECGAKIDDENALIIKQKFAQIIMGKMDEKGRVTYDDDDIGYCIGNDLEPDGKPEIVGCEKCAGR